MILVGLAATSGCGGSRQEVRLTSSVPLESPQQRLDDLGASFLNRRLGGTY